MSKHSIAGPGNRWSLVALVVLCALAVLAAWVAHMNGANASGRAYVASESVAAMADKQRGSMSPSGTAPYAVVQGSRESVVADVAIEVRDFDGNIAPGSSVLVAGRVVRGAIGSMEAREELRGGRVFVEERTDARGLVEFECNVGDECYVKVEGRDGLPSVDGPGRIRPLPGARNHYVYRTGRMFAAAVQLSDGTAPVHVTWGVSSFYKPGLVPTAVREAEDRIAQLLSLKKQSVIAFMPAATPPEMFEIQVYHEAVGWFRANIHAVRVEWLRVPSQVQIPEVGVSPPIKLTVRCVDRLGAEQSVSVSAMGGQANGYPRFGVTFPSGVPQPFPPGLVTIGFVHPLLAAACTKDVIVDQSQVVEIQLPFAPREIVLKLVHGGRAITDPVTVEVRSGIPARSYRKRVRGSVSGETKIGVAGDQDNRLRVLWRDMTRDVNVPAGSLDDVVVISFD